MHEVGFEPTHPEGTVLQTAGTLQLTRSCIEVFNYQRSTSLHLYTDLRSLFDDLLVGILGFEPRWTASKAADLTVSLYPNNEKTGLGSFYPAGLVEVFVHNVLDLHLSAGCSIWLIKAILQTPFRA